MISSLFAAPDINYVEVSKCVEPSHELIQDISSSDTLVLIGADLASEAKIYIDHNQMDRTWIKVLYTLECRHEDEQQLPLL